MNEKDMAMMDGIMGVVTQSDGWQEIQMQDPIIVAAEDRFKAAMDKAKGLIPEELYIELSDAHGAALMATGDAGILFGIRVANVIQGVASRPADLSRYTMEQMEGKA